MNQLTQFNFSIRVSRTKQEEWLQITQVNGIGNLAFKSFLRFSNKLISQEVVKLSPEQQKELFILLKKKFEGETK